MTSDLHDAFVYAHRANKDRYRKLLKTHLSNNEREFIEQRLADEEEALLAVAGSLEQDEGPVVGIEHHLLGLAGIVPHEQYSAVAEPDMGDLHGQRHPAQQDDHVAPVELVGFPRRKA